MGGAANLAPEQIVALGRIAPLQAAESLYLAGGSAVAFHFGHRRSEDIDLFSTNPNLDIDALRAELIATFSSVTIRGETDVTLKLVAEGAAIDVVRYPYPPLEAPQPGPAAFPIAGVRDLAAMKLAAISRRGIRRDFWDLFVLTTANHGPSLVEAAEDYVRKFGRQESDLYHVCRSLTYFADAESDPLFPAGMTSERWSEIKTHFEKEAPILLL